MGSNPGAGPLSETLFDLPRPLTLRVERLPLRTVAPLASRLKNQDGEIAGGILAIVAARLSTPMVRPAVGNGCCLGHAARPLLLTSSTCLGCLGPR
jgi:hypothetical protein